MVSIESVSQNTAQFLQNSKLMYVHCVSKEDYKIRLSSLMCLDLICREIHISFIDNLTERRVALVPKHNGRHNMDDLFQNLESPTLISVESSCDIEFLDYVDAREDIYCGTLIWDLKVIPGMPCAHVKHTKTQPQCTTKDVKLPLLDLNVLSSCNCFTQGKKCSVYIDTYREEIPEEIQDDDNLLEDIFRNMSIDEEETDHEDNELNEVRTTDEHEENNHSVSGYCYDEEPEELNVECFKIVGSHWEQRYQDALDMCYEAKRASSVMELRAEFEPDNIKDTNAIKFEFHKDGLWYIMGYCAVRKIPKLKRALHRKEVVSLSIYNMKRIWIVQTKEFRYTAGINIVKRGQWGKDDFQNHYNSVILV
ncbi:hypothetical protein AC249_AIPGENE27160 [Exaiptasia diaphana]|nr:hypothetical protein AC249_AIPGENE27160 [Exaiptasia diaphana]